MSRYYRVEVCGEYANITVYSDKTSNVETAVLSARQYAKSQGRENVSIHSFDRDGAFSHAVEWK